MPRLPAAMVALGVLVVSLVGTSGEFPLGDDWSYAGTVQRLVEQGRLRFGNWQSIPILPQIAAGSIAAFLSGGFSFEALRASTLLFWAIGVFALQHAFRDLGLRPALATIGLLTFALNPILLWLSFSFMSDVPAVAFCALTTAGIVRNVRTHSRASLGVAILGAALATLTRQSGLALFAAIAGVQWWCSPPRRGNAFRAFALIAGGAVMLWTAEQLLLRTVGLPALYYLRHDELWRNLTSGGAEAIARPLWRLYTAAIYLALFLLPALLCATPVPTRHGNWRMPLMVTVLAVPLLVGQRSMPLMGNLINREGLGIPLLGDMSFVTPISPWIWWSVTLIGLAALALSIMFLVNLPIADRKHASRDVIAALAIFSGTLALLFLALHAVIGFYDRYLLFLLPPFLCLSLAAAQRLAHHARWQRVAAAAMMTIVAGWGLFATADSMAINRMRWDVLRSVQARGAPSEQIDGGFEFNGWTTGSPWRAVTEPTWLIAFGPQSGYQVEDRRMLRTWLRGDMQLYLLRRR